MYKVSEKPNLGKGRNQDNSEVLGGRNWKILSVGYFGGGKSAPRGFCVIIPNLQGMRVSLVSLGSCPSFVTRRRGYYDQQFHPEEMQEEGPWRKYEVNIHKEEGIDAQEASSTDVQYTVGDFFVVFFLFVWFSLLCTI